MELTIYCGQCQKQTTIDIPDAGPLTIDIESQIKKAGWIYQRNGIVNDTYCSERCAA